MGSLASEGGHERALRRAEDPRRWRPELGGSSKCTAICHVAELPLARSAGGRQCPVRIEIPRASRRRHGAAGAAWLAGGLAGHSIRLELDIGIWLTVCARLTLSEWRWEPVRGGLVRPVRPSRCAVEVEVTVGQEEVRAAGDEIRGRCAAVGVAARVARRICRLLI